MKSLKGLSWLAMRYALKVRAAIGYIDLSPVRIPSSNGMKKHWDDIKNLNHLFTPRIVLYVLTGFTLSEIRPYHLFTSGRTNKFEQGLKPRQNLLTEFTSYIYQNPLG
jgi:hypothetical protein